MKLKGEPLARVCLGAGDDSRLGRKRVCSRRRDSSIRSKVAVRLHDRSRQRSILLVEERKKSLLRPLYLHACPLKSTGCIELSGLSDLTSSRSHREPRTRRRSPAGRRDSRRRDPCRGSNKQRQPPTSTGGEELLPKSHRPVRIWLR